VPNILFVITDGASNNRQQTINSAQSLHARGITVFAVGIGGAKRDELEGIASDKSYVYDVTDFSRLAQIQQTFNKKACQGNFLLYFA